MHLEVHERCQAISRADLVERLRHQRVRDADARVDDHAAAAGRPHHHRVEVEFDDLREVIGELGYTQQEFGERVQIAGWPAAMGKQTRVRARFANHLVGIVIGNWDHAEVDVAFELDLRPAETKAHDRSEERIVRDADHRLERIGDHRLDDHAFRFEPPRHRNREEIAGRPAHLVRRSKSRPDAADVALVQQRRCAELERRPRLRCPPRPRRRRRRCSANLPWITGTPYAASSRSRSSVVSHVSLLAARAAWTTWRASLGLASSNRRIFPGPPDTPRAVPRHLPNRPHGVFRKHEHGHAFVSDA